MVTNAGDPIRDCAICGEPVRYGRGMRGVTGWAVEDDPAEPVVGKEAVLVVHRRCYLATPASERDRLLEEATRDDEGGAGA